MKITKAIASLSAVIGGIVATAAYSILAPAINKGGDCIQESNYYAPSGYIEKCESLVGFDIPMFWLIGYQKTMPIAPIFGLLCGAVIALVLLVRMQSSEDSGSEK